MIAFKIIAGVGVFMLIILVSGKTEAFQYNGLYTGDRITITGLVGVEVLDTSGSEERIVIQTESGPYYVVPDEMGQTMSAKIGWVVQVIGIVGVDTDALRTIQVIQVDQK